MIRFVILLLAVLSYIGNCPIDGSLGIPTGETKIDVSGKVLYGYRCAAFAHEYWLAQ